MAVHVQPEYLFTLSQNRCSSWAGICTYLSPEQQKLVDRAESVTKEYVRKQGDEGDEPNRRSLMELRKAGHSASLDPYQYDSSRLVGSVTVNEEWELDVSDS